ncbi:MAG: caspase family protein [Bacteroidota bacterium]|nr:caspase family protein [Bacteroidota bacterium]
MKNWLAILFLFPIIVLAQFSESQLINTEWELLPKNFFLDNSKDKIKVKFLKNNQLEYYVFESSWETKGTSDMHFWEIKDDVITFWINDRFLKFEGDIKYSSEHDILGIFGKWKNRRMGLTKHKFSGYLIWEKDKFLNFGINEKIKKGVEDSIKRCYTKGEFEKISDYQKRIKKIDQQKLIKKYQEKVIYHLKESYKNSMKNNINEIKLLEYDAENETFALNSKNFGTFFLEVPLKEAQKFKSDYKNTLLGTSSNDIVEINNIDFHIYNNRFELSRIEFSHSYLYKAYAGFRSNQKKRETKNYVYNIKEEIEYTTTDIDYGIGEINIKNIEAKNTISNKSTPKRNKLLIRNYSSVDKNIPKNKKVKNRYALVIGNEDYQSKQRGLSDEQNVDYAVNDAAIFREYALKTLGVKEDNMFFLTNATAVEMGREIKRISEIMKQLRNKGELVVYYAGHGYPHENDKTPYLIPVDVSANDLSYAIKLHDLYRDLSATNAKRITIFIDACFTGGGRSSGLMASRGVRISPKGGTLDGNIVVFSASSGDQSALPYHKENHGMFTYYLLKKLQESKGDIKMGKLADYLQDEVSLQSLKINDKKQNPIINTSGDIVDTWKDWAF